MKLVWGSFSVSELHILRPSRPLLCSCCAHQLHRSNQSAACTLSPACCSTQAMLHVPSCSDLLLPHRPIVKLGADGQWQVVGEQAGDERKQPLHAPCVSTALVSHPCTVSFCVCTTSPEACGVTNATSPSNPVRF